MDCGLSEQFYPGALTQEQELTPLQVVEEEQEEDFSALARSESRQRGERTGRRGRRGRGGRVGGERRGRQERRRAGGTRNYRNADNRLDTLLEANGYEANSLQNYYENYESSPYYGQDDARSTSDYYYF